MSRLSSYLQKRKGEIARIAGVTTFGLLGDEVGKAYSGTAHSKDYLARQEAARASSAQDAAAKAADPANGPMYGAVDTPPDGRVLTTASGKQVPIGTPGVPGYVSEKLLPSGQGTATGDVFNQFRGYTGPQGGTFGGGPSADAAAARKGWESVSGVSGDKLGDTSNWGAARWDAAKRQFGGIGNQDKQTTVDALNSDNPFIKETAQRYADQNGWGEHAVATPDKVRPAPGGIDLSAPAPVADPLANLDLYGQRDSATSNRPVMKSSDTFDSLRAQAQRMATPQMTSPTAPTALAQPQDPFAQFGGIPAPTAGAGAPAPTTFAPAPSVPPADPMGYLPGGVQSMPLDPLTQETAISAGHGGVRSVPTESMPAPALGGMGSRATMAGPMGAGSGFGASSRPSVGASNGLLKLGRARNPMMPESPQNSGLFSAGLRKLGKQPPSPTGSPMPGAGGSSPIAY